MSPFELAQQISFSSQMGNSSTTPHRSACPKAQHIITTKEGGEAHCGVNDASLEHQIIFDWLDDIFR